MINNTKNPVVISLGTNIGNRLENLQKAIRLIKEFSVVLRKSNVYRTPPWGYSSNNFFLNMGVVIETDFSPELLLKELKSIELKMGRLKSKEKEYVDRLIDLDILFYNDLEMNSKDLKIPHPKIAERKFSIVVLKDIYGESKLPILGKTADDLLKETKDLSTLKLYKNQI